MINGVTRAFGLSGEKFMAMVDAEPTKPAGKAKRKKKSNGEPLFHRREQC
jgi:hypothetical protein